MVKNPQGRFKYHHKNLHKTPIFDLSKALQIGRLVDGALLSESMRPLDFCHVTMTTPAGEIPHTLTLIILHERIRNDIIIIIIRVLRAAKG